MLRNKQAKSSNGLPFGCLQSRYREGCGIHWASFARDGGRVIIVLRRPLLLGNLGVIFLLFTVIGCSDSNVNRISSVPLNWAHELLLPEKLRYELTNDTGELVGLGIFQSYISSRDSSLIVLEERYSRADNDEANDTVTTLVSSADFSAVGGTRAVEQMTEVDIQSVSYSWEILQTNEEKKMLRKIDNLTDSEPIRTKGLPNLDIYANSSSIWLWRQLPLEIGYTASYMTVDPYEEKWQLVSITVPQSEVLTMSFGDTPVWRVLIRSGRATRSAWIEQAEPHRVLKWDNGLTIMTLID